MADGVFDSVPSGPPREGVEVMLDRQPICRSVFEWDLVAYGIG